MAPRISRKTTNAAGGSRPNHVPTVRDGSGGLGDPTAGVSVTAGALELSGAADAPGDSLGWPGSLGAVDGSAEAPGTGSPVFTSTWVKCDQRYSRVVSPESWISFASSRPK